MANIPPPPPPPQKKTKPRKPPHNQTAAVNAILHQFPGFAQYMPMIREAAARWGMDPVYLLATLAVETNGKPGTQPNGSGAYGLAQVVDTSVNKSLNPQQYASFIAQFGQATTAHKLNPVWAINYMAWRMTGHLRQYGTLNDAYSKGYNPGFSGNAEVAHGPADLIPGWYQAQAQGPQSPQDTAGRSVDTSGAKQTLTDPWAVIGSNGKLGFVQSPGPPKNSVTYAGTPLTRSQFLQLWQTRLNPIYESYTGRTATAQQAAAALKSGVSDYHLQTTLAALPSFYKSPIWKSAAPSYVAAWRSIYGNVKVDRGAVQYAIVHNLNGDGFQELLRQRADYVHSNEFKQNATSMRTVYEGIYGQSDANAGNVIKQAALAGWTPDQFAAYLRHLPAYKQSNEYHQRALTFLDNIGLITGKVSTMQQAPQVGAPGTTRTTIGPGLAYSYPTPGAPPPHDKRLPTATSPAPSGPEAGMVTV